MRFITHASTTLALAALLFAPTIGAQQAGITAIPDSIVSRLDRSFGTLGGADAPGCAIGMSRDGQPVLTRAYGMANLEYGVPNTPETVFESGSVAKQFTAAAVVLLAQDGKLSLDDDIRKYLPEVPDFGRPISIRNLLTHTSGLRDQWGLLELKGVGPGRQVHTLPLILDLVAYQKALNFEPGAEYLYSNTGYALAAMIVNRVSGQSFAKFSDERLFKPLGMTNTRWRDDFTAVVKNRATAYNGSTMAGFHLDMPFTNVHGNGGLLTTVGDLLKWNANLDAPSEHVGGQAFVRALEAPMVLNNGRAITYALGLDVATANGIRQVTHGGSTAGYRTWLGRLPTHRTSVAVLCNTASANPTGFAMQAMNVLVPRLPLVVAAAAASDGGAVSPSLDSAALTRYVGLYRSPATQAVLQTVVRDGRLATILPVTGKLTSVATDRFQAGGRGDLVFRFAGVIVRDLLLVNDGDTVRYEPVATASAKRADLAAYAGSYWSNELDTRLRVVARDSVLVVLRRPADEVVLRPTFRDGFMAPGVGTVVFSRDARGRVTGLGVYGGRVRNVRFDRERSPQRQ